MRPAHYYSVCVGMEMYKSANLLEEEEWMARGVTPRDARFESATATLQVAM